MSRKAAIGIFTPLAVLLMGFVAFQSYYFAGLYAFLGAMSEDD